MTKTIYINTPDGRYKLDAHHVAHNRATYYASKGDNYDEEYNYVLSDDFELKDWLMNNLNWSDISEHVEKCSDTATVSNFEWDNVEVIDD